MLAQSVNSLAFRAYFLIWNEWFRDENLLDSIEIPKDNGPDSELNALVTNPSMLKRRGKRHDYFTMCLPFAQKGDPVSVGLGGFADVDRGSSPVRTTLGDGGQVAVRSEVVLDPPSGGFPHLLEHSQDANYVTVSNINSATGNELEIRPFSTDGNKLQANLSTATAVTINQLRTAFQTQRLLA